MKKISLSKREKTILIVVIPALIVVLLYQFVYLPIQNKITTLQQEWELVESEYKIKQAKISGLPTLIDSVETEKTKLTELSTVMYGDIDQENIMTYLQDLQDQSGLKIIGFKYKEEIPDVLLKAIQAQAATSKSKTSEKEDKDIGTETSSDEEDSDTTTPSLADFADQMYVKTFEIRFDTNYAEALTFLTLVDENQKTLSTNKFILKNKDSFEDDPNRPLYFMEGEITMNFYTMGAIDNYVTEEPPRLETAPLPKSENGSNPFFIDH